KCTNEWPKRRRSAEAAELLRLGRAEFPRPRAAIEQLRVSEWPLLTKVATLDRAAVNREDGSNRPHRSPLEQKGEPAHKRSRARLRLPKPSTSVSGAAVQGTSLRQRCT